MKKIKVLLLAVCLFGATAHMKAQKQQYVKFTSIPEDATASQKGSMLKKAMKGEQIPGASVRASADSYTAVFGQDTYDKVMKAKNLIIGPAKGGEKNFAIGPNGPEQSGTLKEGTEIISLPDGTPVAKVGTNFCFNALLPADAIAADDGEDEDNQTVVKKDKTKTTNTGAPTIINVGTQGNQQELTWSAGYAVYSTGRNDRQNDFVVDAALYKMIQDSKQCCTGGATNVVGTPTLYSAAVPVTGANLYGGQAVGASNGKITIYEKPNATDYIGSLAEIAKAGAMWYTAINGQRVYLTGNSNLVSTTGFQGPNDTIWDNTWR